MTGLGEADEEAARGRRPRIRGPNRSLSAKEFAALQKRYRTILTRGRKELPATPVRTVGKKRGHIAKSDAGNLWEDVGKYETENLRFASGPMASFTHNLSERKIQMSRVEEKVVGCFRSCRYAVARVSGGLNTMSCQGYNPSAATVRPFTC